MDNPIIPTVSDNSAAVSAAPEKDKPADESSDAISLLSSASSSDRKSYAGSGNVGGVCGDSSSSTSACVDLNLNGCAWTEKAVDIATVVVETAPTVTALIVPDTESIEAAIGAGRESVVSFQERRIGESSSDSETRGGDLSLPWGSKRERGVSAISTTSTTSTDNKMVVGEYVLQSLFLDFAQKAERKVDAVLSEPLARPLSKSFQRGEDPQFDQLISCFHAVAEHCLPSLLRTLFAWYDRQNVDYSHLSAPVAETGKQKTETSKAGSGSTKSSLEFLEKEHLTNKRNLAVDYLFALVLIEILKQLPFHPGHEHLVTQVENMAFKHFKYRDPSLVGPNSVNFHIVSDLYAEVSGILAQSRFQSVRKKFMQELKELRFKETTPPVVSNVIALLMGMKFFRVKMVPIEEFEASFQFMQECATYFLEIKDKDIKHAMAGLLVEILMPVAASVKNEVNVPVLKNFVEMLYPTCLDMCAKKKHVLALFPLVTCLLCVAHKQFFLHNWHHFLTLCLSNLKNRDTKMSRVAVESLYRLLWVYMIRIKCESNSVTQSRLQSIVNSLFPKGSKVVVPRDTPLNIFVKIIQFIAQERMDFAMKEIVFDLLSVGRPIRLLMPERMSIGLRAFLVIADNLQQKEGEPPMPRSLGVLPSGNTIRIKKTYVCKVLTDDEAKAIGVASYYPFIRKTFEEILRLLDAQVGRTMMLTATLNQSKEPDEHAIGERKPKVDFLKTCVAAIPRLLPDAMSITDLVALLSRLTVHMDEDLRGLAYQSIQSILVDFKEHRETAIHVFVQFVVSDISDAHPSLVDTSLRILIQFVTAWRNALTTPSATTGHRTFRNSADENRFAVVTLPMVLWEVESLGFVMLSQSRFTPRRLGFFLLKEAKALREAVFAENSLMLMKNDRNLLDILDSFCKSVMEENCASLLPTSEKTALSPSTILDLQWVVERSCNVWNAGFPDSNVPLMVQDASAAIRSFSSPPNNCDVWTEFISGLMSQKGFLGKCPMAVLAFAWPMVYARIQAVHTLIDPGPVNENRVSLLKTVRQVLSERELYSNLWKNYLIMACSMLPPHSIFSGNFRCISPDIALSTSSSESNGSEKSESRSSVTHIPAVTAHGFYKMAIRLMRSEATDLPDSIVIGLGKTNPEALKDLMEELGPLIKEAVDRKQENVRRKKRKDALRLELAKLFYLIAKEGGIVTSSLYTSSENTLTFLPSFVEYIDGTRMYLETETDKENAAVLASIQVYYCKFITELIRTFPMEQRESLLSTSQRQQMFNLLATWTGKYGLVFKDAVKHSVVTASPELEFEAIRAMSSLLCCGKVFDRSLLMEDSLLFRWLDLLLATKEDRIAALAQETVTILLCMNPDTSYLLDWVVDRCFTAPDDVADRCFSSIASVFCTRDYPCDQYSSIINLALMNTGCPRVNIQEVALELLQLLDKRFFGQAPIYGTSPSPEKGGTPLEKGGMQRSTLNDVLLSGGNYTRNQLILSEQLAKLHPDLTMPIFSEITYRFQTARPPVQHNLLTYIVPWLYNLELVDFSSQTSAGCEEGAGEGVVSAKGQGWGSPEGTEMVLNNLLYISVVFGDDLPKELEQAWSSVCCAWPNNLNIVLKYLTIVASLSSARILPVAKRIVRYMARARPERLVNHLVDDLQAVDNLCAAVEKMHTPPFFRITSVKRLPVTGIVSDKKSSDEFTSGTIHTKRHTHSDSIGGSEGGTRRSSGNTPAETPFVSKSRSTADFVEDVGNGVLQIQTSQSQLHPLPMPEYGGYFAPVGDLLLEANANITTMHKCSFAIAFLGDLLLDGINVAWTIHLPIMLHIAVLGMDSQRQHVFQHCRKLLENLLVVLACHSDHCSVAKLLLEKKSVGLAKPSFTLTTSCRTSMETLCRSDSMEEIPLGEGSPNTSTATVQLVGSEKTNSKSDMERMVMDLINFLASHTGGPLWSFEDITARVWACRSATDLSRFVHCVSRVFNASLPLTRITQRWAEMAFQYGLNSSSRHYAGRSLQIFRALEIPVTFQVLSEILSRLVETVAEAGDDLQGYVTELVLTLEACTDTLASLEDGVFSEDGQQTSPSPAGKVSPKHEKTKDGRMGHSRTISCHLPGGIDFDYRQRSVSDSSCHIHRTYSTQTLMNSPALESGGVQTLDDKISLLSLLFWISMSILESDYEHEFLLALRLMNKVISKFPLEKAECQERIEKVRNLAKWSSFPGVQALVLKGCTSSVTFEPTLQVLSKFIGCFGNVVIDPNRIGFPLNVLAFLPYHLLHFDDPTALCLDSTRQIAAAARDISPGLESLATVMTLYTKRAFAKDAHQWGKCVVKYLFDVYRDLTNILMTFLIEILDKGPLTIQQQTLNVIYYILHYVDINSVTSSVTAELLRVVTRLLDGQNWRECQSILKLAVIRSSSLMPPGNNVGAQSSSISFESLGLMSSTHYVDRPPESDIVVKKELPGRTLDFAFDVSVTPIAGHKAMAKGHADALSDVFLDGSRKVNGDPTSYGWKKPSMSQSRTRERLVGLLAVCGQQVGVPKSPSIVFNEFGDVGEPSMSSSSDDATSTVVGGDEHRKGSVVGESSLRDDRSTSENTFTVFKDFDFLEYELDSGENESIDNFNWGVRRTLSNVQDVSVKEKVRSVHRTEPRGSRSSRGSLEEVFSPKKELESSDDELGSVEIVDMLHEESSVDPTEGEISDGVPASGSRSSKRSLESPSDQDDAQTANL